MPPITYCYQKPECKSDLVSLDPTANFQDIQNTEQYVNHITGTHATPHGGKLLRIKVPVSSANKGQGKN